MRTWLVLIAMLAAVTTACSKEDGASDNDSRSTSDAGQLPGDEATFPFRPENRPDGPSADVSEKPSESSGPFLAAARPFDAQAAGWVEEERFASGEATSYSSTNGDPDDGKYEVEPRDSKPYKTRVVVRRPADAADFNGTVVVEWHNVSGGVDANPDFSYLDTELIRGGYAWVGVTTQSIGIEGGPTAVSIGIDAISGQGLKGIDPARYGSLSHPGDSYSYDIYTQIARAVRSNDSEILGDLEPELLLAAGESQSAFALTTYANAIQPSAQQFDGFFVHSRGGSGLPLNVDGAYMDIAGALALPASPIRDDLTVPVFTIETESDVTGLINYYPARQDDSEMFRLWEIAGTAHVDYYMMGELARGVGCGPDINDGPQHFVLKAALRHLNNWMRTGEVPPGAERFEVDGAQLPAPLRDEVGIIKGGVRTPVVDVPVEVHSGELAQGTAIICLLLGSTKPMPATAIAERYSSPEDYQAKFGEATEAAIEAGYMLEDDREAILATARPELVTPAAG